MSDMSNWHALAVQGSVSGLIPMRGGILLQVFLATSAFCMVATGVSLAETGARDAADALARKFIEGPATEARRSPVTARKSESGPKGKTVEANPAAIKVRRELDFLSRALEKARRRHQPQATKPERRAKVLPRLQAPKSKVARTGLPIKAPRTVPAPSSRVTVLMVMRKGFDTRRTSRDPIVCLSAECYVSQGAVLPATAVPRRDTLRLGNAPRANDEACLINGACVFRAVRLLNGMDDLQPVNLGLSRHVLSRPVTIAADPTCKLLGKHLSCQWAVETPDYRLWVVPERLARRVGADGLVAAVKRGLVADPRHAAVQAANRLRRSIH